MFAGVVWRGGRSRAFATSFAGSVGRGRKWIRHTYRVQGIGHALSRESEREDGRRAGEHGARRPEDVPDGGAQSSLKSSSLARDAPRRRHSCSHTRTHTHTHDTYTHGARGPVVWHWGWGLVRQLGWSVCADQATTV
eukprot:scaffold2866_cov148-Isochrysis_galbana.AAC.12